MVADLTREQLSGMRARIARAATAAEQDERFKAHAANVASEWASVLAMAERWLSLVELARRQPGVAVGDAVEAVQRDQG